MPTNLKSLLSRSRSKNELKLRESKDEISPAGISESESSGDGGSSCKCESSGLHVCLNDACCCRQKSESPSTVVCSIVPSKAGPPYLQNENDPENNCFSPLSSSDLSYNNNCPSDESPDSSCFIQENYPLQSLNCETAASTTTTTTTTAMIPPGSSLHNGYLASPTNHLQAGRGGVAYPCCSQNYGPTAYDMIPSSRTGVAGSTAGEYCGYFLDEKSNVGGCPSSRLVGVMDQSDNGEMRRNSSCKTLFFSCSTLHQPSCSSFESSHMDPTSDFSRSSCENHGSSSSRTSSGNVAAVPTSMKIPSLNQARTSVADGCCGSLACGSPSAACCTFNVKDGSPCQSLSMRKCETVLALSNFNGSVSTTAAPVTTSSKSYARNSGGTTATPSYSNFSPAPPVTTGATVSHLSSASTAPSSNVGGKVRVMKEKIFSTSSSALNCLLHSSSRTGKLLSGWKLNSASASSNGGSNTNVGHISNMFSGSSEGGNCLGVNCQPNKHYLGTTGISSSATVAGASDNNKLGSTASARITGHHHHKSRSQLSISENSFSSSPAPLTPVNRLRRNVSVNNTSSFCPAGGSLSAHSSYSRSSSVASFGWKEKEDPFEQSLLCRLCLCNVPLEDTMEILACSCRYCKDVSHLSPEKKKQKNGQIFLSLLLHYSFATFMLSSPARLYLFTPDIVIVNRKHFLIPLMREKRRRLSATKFQSRL